ncbi:hypothetical protein [Natronolimnohabitans innermongolicus]|uniref:Uncharacterized protein n=1 Tax=Natronolimnohabitans innermongolicus JCM 12255 TaxID=1227499 RepID=L9X7Q0_9EURY|nr:hypothetical protein [Natronolimnohabitans innermongolicus]ELY57622.1 hypothetical protein C493_09071 [Natronolimnohabitans innermongolicus JCM 12255]
MSVIRQPGILGRTARRRVVGVTAALSAATVEAVAVGVWFSLVAGSRTTSTALAGLGILFCGALVRAIVFGATVNEVGDLLKPERLSAALLLTGSWLVWLLVAELIGGVGGIVVAGVVLAGALTAQLFVERRVFCLRSTYLTTRTPLVPGCLLAAGASALLAAVWFVDVTLATPPIPLEATTVVLRVDALHVGLVLFGLFAFLAHQRRFERLLEP